MFLTNNPSIQEVLFFPQMRPEPKKVELSEEEKTITIIIYRYSNSSFCSNCKSSNISSLQW